MSTSTAPKASAPREKSPKFLMVRAPVERDLHARMAAASVVLGFDREEIIKLSLRRFLDEFEATGSVTVRAKGNISTSTPVPEEKVPLCDDPSSRIGIGWPDDPPPPPKIDELLPADFLQRMLDIWKATGCNLLQSITISALAEIEDGNGHRMIADALEADVIDRLEGVRAKWNGGEDE